MVFKRLITNTLQLRKSKEEILVEPTWWEENVMAMVPEVARPWFEQLKEYLDLSVESPGNLFNTMLVLLVATALLIRFLDSRAKKKEAQDEFLEKENIKPKWVKSLQLNFLPVFWLLRTAFWMSGPYFYAAYSSKVINGKPATMVLVSQIFLVGFASIALFGPSFGRAMDQFGRKKGVITAALIYGLGALSTQSSSLIALFVGRALGGIGTSLMGSAPEAWLICEIQKAGADHNGKWLRDTFGWAYSMDSIVAIAAGQLATYAASNRGPTGPFQVSPIFLLLASGIAALFWKENVAQKQEKSKTAAGEEKDEKKQTPSIGDALKVVMADEKILLLGAVQSLFESSMYIFVMIWPRVMNAAVQNYFGRDTVTPYGTVFSCFMACCMLGSSVFGKLAKRSSATTLVAVTTETSTIGFLLVSCLSLTGSAIILSGTADLPEQMVLAGLIATFFLFEACVGMYFPSIGTLRSRFIPNSHRSIIMTLFGVPLNILVVTVFLFIDKIGTLGAMSIAALELGIATFCMMRLRSIWRVHIREVAQVRWAMIRRRLKITMILNSMKGSTGSFTTAPTKQPSIHKLDFVSF